MLQSTGYSVGEYFAWLHRTTDFRTVTKRCKLDYTKKARLLLVGAWLLRLTVCGLAILLLVQFILTGSIIILVSALAAIFASPLIIAYGIVVPLWIGQKLIQEPRQRKMIESARQILAEHPALKIAIAGSYGKTTAKEILCTVLSEGKRVACTPGNMNTPVGISRFALTLDGNEEILIFELGEERFGDVRQMCDLTQPDMGMITGINEAHLSSFGTLDRTVETIFGLQDYLGDRPLYKNQESPLVAEKISKGDDLAFSRDGTNGWRVSGAKTDIYGTAFTAQKGSKSLQVHTALLGKHNIGAIVAAISIADAAGLSSEQVIAGVEKTVPFEHRMQPRLIRGAWVIDDTYNGNSQGVQAGLLLLGELSARRRVYVTPGLVEQGDKTADVHVTIGQQVAEVAEVVVLMKNSVTDYIVSGLQQSKFKGTLLVIDNPLEFYTNLDQFVAGGDVVLMQNDWTDNYK
jgi:UDP-N-acetylmuramoyl-tripeptide--D-alanyl-D-alanine ligase